MLLHPVAFSVSSHPHAGCVAPDYSFPDGSVRSTVCHSDNNGGGTLRPGFLDHVTVADAVLNGDSTHHSFGWPTPTWRGLTGASRTTQITRARAEDVKRWLTHQFNIMFPDPLERAGEAASPPVIAAPVRRDELLTRGSRSCGCSPQDRSTRNFRCTRFHLK
jgi:hypothetical protein